jgi:hypothetical protein
VSVARALARTFKARAGVIFVVALAVRLAFMIGFRIPGPVTEDQAAWLWGAEQAAVARAVLRGDGLADPFARGTGPTAWCGAVYPMILAGVIACFGRTGQAVSTVTALINALSSAGTAVGLLRLGQALGRPRLGRVSAWIWVFHPSAIYFPVSYVWDTGILAFGVTQVLVLLARAGRTPGPGRAVRAGAALGLLALVNANALALVPVALAYMTRRSGIASTARVWAAFAAGALVVLSPWLVRNRILLGTFQPKATLGVELRVGNNDDADGGFRPHLHPRDNLEEFEAYRQLGEVGYSRRCQGIFLDWLLENPSDFARLTGTRIKIFWLGFSPFEPFPLRSGRTKARDWQGWIKWWVYSLDGVLALAGLAVYSDRLGGRLLLGGVLLFFPMVYYAAHVIERYRFPIEPLLVYMGAALLLALFRRLDLCSLGTAEKSMGMVSAP